MDIVQQHVHPGEVERRPVHLLPVIVPNLLHLTRHAQQQRAGAAGGVIDRFEPLLAGGNDPGEDRGDFLGGVKLPSFLARAAGELADEIFIGIAQHVAVHLLQLKIDAVEVDQHLGDQLVLGGFGAAQLGAGQVEVFEQLVEIILAVGAHGGLFDAGEDRLEIVQDEAARPVAPLAVPALSNLTEQFGGFQEIAQLLNRFLAHRFQHRIAAVGAFAHVQILNTVLHQNAVGIAVHLFGEVFVENEAQNVVAELVRIHLAAQRVRNIPKLLLQPPLLFFRQ